MIRRYRPEDRPALGELHRRSARPGDRFPDPEAFDRAWTIVAEGSNGEIEGAAVLKFVVDANWLIDPAHGTESERRDTVGALIYGAAATSASNVLGSDLSNVLGSDLGYTFSLPSCDVLKAPSNCIAPQWRDARSRAEH